MQNQIHCTSVIHEHWFVPASAAICLVFPSLLFPTTWLHLYSASSFYPLYCHCYLLRHLPMTSMATLLVLCRMKYCTILLRVLLAATVPWGLHLPMCPLATLPDVSSTTLSDMSSCQQTLVGRWVFHHISSFPRYCSETTSDRAELSP